MKRLAYALSVLSILLIAGCSESRKDKKGAGSDLKITIDTLTYDAWTPLYEGADCGFHMDMNIEWPTKAATKEALENMQKSITGLLFGSRLATTDIQFAMNAYNTLSTELYFEHNDPEDEFQKELPSYIMDWSESKEGRFMEPYDGMVSYQGYVHGYSGGAHGMDALNCITFDMKTGEVIKSTDLFTEDHEDRLIESLRANLLCTVDDTDMLFEKDIYPVDNFYLTSKGITYIYQRYEIGPYVLGIIEVTIPWKEIRDILKTEKHPAELLETDRMNHNPIINN